MLPKDRILKYSCLPRHVTAEAHSTEEFTAVRQRFISIYYYLNSRQQISERVFFSFRIVFPIIIIIVIIIIFNVSRCIFSFH